MCSGSIVFALQDDKDRCAHDRDDIEEEVEKMPNDCVWRKSTEWLLDQFAQSGHRVSS
jgi:hypothetical protein